METPPATPWHTPRCERWRHQYCYISLHRLPPNLTMAKCPTLTTQDAKAMKDIVITVVNFFAWVGIIVATAVGYFAMKGT